MKNSYLTIICFLLLCFPLFGQEEATIDVFTMSSSFNDFNTVYSHVEATLYGASIFAYGEYYAYWWDGDSWEIQHSEVFWDPEPSPYYLYFDDDVDVTNIASKGNGNFKVEFSVVANGVIDTVSNNFSVTDVTAPSAPTNLTISNSGGNPKLDWDANSEEDLRRYRVYRVDGDPTSWIVSGTSYTDDEVEISQQGNYVIYEVKAEDWTSNLSSASNQDSIRGILGKPIVQRGTSLRNSFFLSQNYPNPFNPTTTISFDIPKETNVDLQIFNIKGQIVNNLINTRLEPGNYEVKFDASSLPSGVYFYRISAGRYSDVKRMLVVK